MEDGCFQRGGVFNTAQPPFLCNQGKRLISEVGGTCTCALRWQSILFVRRPCTCSRMTTICCQLVVLHGNYSFIGYSVVNAGSFFPSIEEDGTEENTFAILTERSCN